MPKRNTSGPSKGRRSPSPRPNSEGKSFTRNNDSNPFKRKKEPDAEKPFRKFSSAEDKSDASSRSTREPSQRPRRSDSEERPSFKKASPGRGRNTSSDSGRIRTYKKFDDGEPRSKPGYGSAKLTGQGGTGSHSNNARSERPFKKYSSDEKPRQSERRSSFPGGSKEERPYKKFDKPNSGRDSSYKKLDKPTFKKTDSGSERPSKRFDKASPTANPFNRKAKSNEEGSPSKYERRAFTKRPPETKESSFKKDASGFKTPRNTNQSFKGKPETKEDSLSQTGKIRLNKFIANSGVCSRREADELITMGLITVNGKTVTELGYKVNLSDEVRHEGKVLRAEKPVYILLNKPKGFLTTTADPQERNTVMHLIGNIVKERVYPVGRLDRNTTGLLLLTNDGDLAEKLMHPSYNVKKIYKVELDRPLTKADAQRILDGVKLQEGRAIIDDLAIVSEDRKTVGLEIHIGWNRVVRRIFESLEYTVVKLDRSVYAGLNKKDLSRGDWRFLKKEELVLLKHFQ